MSALSPILVGETSAHVRQAATWLEQAKQPVVIAGRGTLWGGATAHLIRLCHQFPALRVASTPSAKGVFPEHHAQSLGVWGFSGHASALEAVRASDLLLIVGTRLHEPSSGEWDARLRARRVIRIDRDPQFAEAASAESLCITGDAADLLLALSASSNASMALTPPACDGSGLPRFAGPGSVDCFVKPQALCEAIGRLAPGVPVSADAGNSMCWAIEWLERREARGFQVSVDWGTMGFALPAAIGCSLARGAAPSIALTGDGALAMAGGDLHCAVELELPLIVIALNDGGSGMVRAGSAAWFGPDMVPDPDYRYRMNLAAFARAFCAQGFVVTSLEGFEARLQEALTRPTPTLLDVQVDPTEVPRAVRARVAGLATKSNSTAPPLREGGGIC